MYLFTVTEYFKGHTWKVHPDFVYCEYNSLKDMDKELENSGESYFRDREDSFDTPEEQVLHFLSRAGRPGWKWMSVSKIFYSLCDFNLMAVGDVVVGYPTWQQ